MPWLEIFKRCYSSANELPRLLAEYNINADTLKQHSITANNANEAYGRKVLFKNSEIEVMLATWSKNSKASPHNHGRSQGLIWFAQGSFVEDHYHFTNDDLVNLNETNSYPMNSVAKIDSTDIHSCQSLEDGLSLHIYSPPITEMKVWDLDKKQTLTVADNCGAWIPVDASLIIESKKWRTTSPKSEVIVITYTTLYREGGSKFKKAAETLADDKKNEYPHLEIILQNTDSKTEFLNTIELLKAKNKIIREFHFIGHSGVYGIMFGTTNWPEQFSPYEWRQQSWPLSAKSELYFHACRTARWFAPYLANHFKVPVYGYWWYTSFSAKKNKLKTISKDKLYIVSVPGKKSHGLLGSIAKYSGLSKIYPMQKFTLQDHQVNRSYDQVASLYEDTFEDIKVRSDEWKWLNSEIDFNKNLKILDIGCGNAAFLRQIAHKIASGCGVDASEGMLHQARKKTKAQKINNLYFSKIEGPQLPHPDNSFDYVISVLSFRYLDWDPMVQEILRVLKPGGKILILDMVASPVKISEYPFLIISKLKHYLQRIKQPKYYSALAKMVSTTEWQQMLKYNPMRAEHEYRWYLKSRFPDSQYKCINIGWNSRIVTFNSQPVYTKQVQKMSFP